MPYRSLLDEVLIFKENKKHYSEAERLLVREQLQKKIDEKFIYFNNLGFDEI
jgi:hypothetical protein